MNLKKKALYVKEEEDDDEGIEKKNEKLVWHDIF
jgi:hypothetical protein